MDVIDHLEQDHRRAERLLEQLAESEPGTAREELVDELEEALSLHMAVEEQFLYPVVVDVMGDDSSTEAEVEHDLAREGLSKLRALSDAPGFGAAVDMVKAGIQHHVEEEEHEIFPELRGKAGDQLASMDPEALEAEVIENGSISNGSEMTRDELYARAQQADIPGRSQMSKDELAAALSQRG